jgi:hypothetical protein
MITGHTKKGKVAAKQNNGVVNTALQQRISRYVDISGSCTVNNIVPTI